MIDLNTNSSKPKKQSPTVLSIMKLLVVYNQQVKPLECCCYVISRKLLNYTDYLRSRDLNNSFNFVTLTTLA